MDDDLSTPIESEDDDDEYDDENNSNEDDLIEGKKKKNSIGDDSGENNILTDRLDTLRKKYKEEREQFNIEDE